MVTRPIFLPTNKKPYVASQVIDFTWIMGMAKSQARKRVISLHQSAATAGRKNVLEISTASNSTLGENLSAFNLPVTINFGNEAQPDHQTHSVETIYQSSKVGVYEGQVVGPHPDWLGLEGKEVKSKIKQTKMDKITLYRYGTHGWPAEPSESFFTWLYIRGLMQQPGLLETLTQYDGFTDIYFNPKKTKNCQARAAAQAVSLYRAGLLHETMNSRQSYLAFAKKNPSNHVGR